MLTRAMRDAINIEAASAIAYLPAEDKVNLGLACASLPVLPEPSERDNARALILAANDQLAKSQEVITDLTAKLEAANAKDDKS